MSQFDINNPRHAAAYLASAASFLTEWPEDWTAGDLCEALCCEVLPDEVTVWEPFEGWETGCGDQGLHALIENAAAVVIRACFGDELPLKVYLTEISVRWGEQVVQRKHVVQAHSPEEAATETLHTECSYVGCDPSELDEQADGWYSRTWEHFFYKPKVKEIDPRDAAAVLRYFS